MLRKLAKVKMKPIFIINRTNSSPNCVQELEFLPLHSINLRPMGTKEEECSLLIIKLTQRDLIRKAYSHLLITLQMTPNCIQTLLIKMLHQQKKSPLWMTLTLSHHWCLYFQKIPPTSSRVSQPMVYGSMSHISTLLSMVCGSTVLSLWAWVWA